MENITIGPSQNVMENKPIIVCDAVIKSLQHMPLNPEEIDHINVVNWFNHKFPELADDLHHFANERKCSVMQGRKLKRMGVKRGVFDFFLAIPIPSRGKSGLWLELKVGKNKPSKEQMAFGTRKAHLGYECIIAWGFEEAQHAILTYLKPFISNS